MSHGYHSIAFTEDVLEAQSRYGSRAAVERYRRVHDDAETSGRAREQQWGPPPEPRVGAGDPLTPFERDFVSQLDGFYIATVSETGWPYVQFRGGPPGFIRTPDEHTIAWADFRGNRQYISVGNLAAHGRGARIFLAYARQLRLKVFGIARVEDPTPATSADVGGALALEGYRAKVEREVR